MSEARAAEAHAMQAFTAITIDFFTRRCRTAQHLTSIRRRRGAPNETKPTVRPWAFGAYKLINVRALRRRGGLRLSVLSTNRLNDQTVANRLGADLDPHDASVHHRPHFLDIGLELA